MLQIEKTRINKVTVVRRVCRTLAFTTANYLKSLMNPLVEPLDCLSSAATWMQAKLVLIDSGRCQGLTFESLNRMFSFKRFLWYFFLASRDYASGNALKVIWVCFFVTWLYWVRCDDGFECAPPLVYEGGIRRFYATVSTLREYPAKLVLIKS